MSRKARNELAAFLLEGILSNSRTDPANVEENAKLALKSADALTAACDAPEEPTDPE